MRATAFLSMLWVTIATASEADSVLAHPPFATFYSCAEHYAGQMPSLGDELGTDCFVQKLTEVSGRTWVRAYRDGGLKNEDWYGWNQNVLSPCDCVVSKVHNNPVTNSPGVLGKPPATYVLLARSDGIQFMVAHLQSIAVREGQRLSYGQPFAKVGNNGYSRQPHIHMGAWKGEVPLQLRFDQKYMKKPEYQVSDVAPIK